MQIRLHHGVIAGAILAAGTAVWAAAPQAPALDTAPAASSPAAPAAIAAAPPARGGWRGAGGRGGPGGGGGGGGAAAAVAPLPDAEIVELTPPLDKNGNFKVAPKTTWRDVQSIRVDADMPRGKVTGFQIPGTGGAGAGGRAGGGGRSCWVYVPAGYKEGTDLPMMVDHDGAATAVVQTQLIAAMDTLIAAKKIPMIGAVFIAPVQRSQEYDTVSGKYAEYIEKEVIPVAEKTGNVTFTRDPEGRGIIGQSSGSAAAMAMAWFHPEWYHRVISYSGSFTSIQKSQAAPEGAWEYHQTLIPNSDKKPIRIWMEVGSNDLNNQFGDWRIANNNMANVLKAKGYDYQFLWADDAGHVEGGVERQTIAEAMEWVWKTYQPK